MKKIQVKLDDDGVIEEFEWNFKEEYEERAGFSVISVPDDAEIIPYVSKITEVDGKISIDNSGEMTQKGKEAIAKTFEAKSKQDEISSLKAELAGTDYVVAKIAEAQALGEDVSPLLDEYKETLNRRKELRRLINEKELKTLRQK